MDRRGFLGAILAGGVAPALVKAEILMPVRKIIVPPLEFNRIPSLPEFEATRNRVMREMLDNMYLATGNAFFEKSWRGDALHIRRIDPRLVYAVARI